MAALSRVVIAGASIAGLTTAEALRSEGFGGEITLVGEEAHLPYGRPPLSKQVLLGSWSPEEAALCGRAELDALGVEFLAGTRVTSLDVASRCVSVGARTLSYDRLVIATGAVARPLPAARRLAGVHGLRTLDDVIALRADLERARRVVVVGAGILGSEIAAAARSMGLDVTLIGRSQRLGFGAVGDLLSAKIADLHREHGVRVRLGVQVRHLGGTTRVHDAVLSDGRVLPADLVVAAIGSVPATGWLRDSGLDLSDGVACDADGMAAPGVHAVGDVASWRDPELGAAVRVEHQSNAQQQAQAVARLIATGERSAAIVPFFWSELHGTRIQASGRFAAGSRLEILSGAPEDNGFVAASRRQGRVSGVVGWNSPRQFRLARSAIPAKSLAAAV